MTESLPLPGRGPDGQELADGDWNRRGWQRLTSWDLPPLTARLMSVGDVHLLDISRGGARLQSTHRVLPGTTVALLLLTPDGTLLVRGRILRARLVRFDQGGLGYEAGVVFDDPIQAANAADQKSLATTGTDTTNAPGGESTITAPPPSWPSVLTLRADLSHSHDELMAILDDNDW